MRRRWLPLVSVVGVVVAHALDFSILYGQGESHDHRLLATGHGYWPIAVGVAALVGVVVLFLAVGRGAGRGLGGSSARREPPVIGRSIVAVVACQIALFTGMEILERALVGVAPVDLIRSPEFTVGLVLQVLVGAAAVVVLTILERLTERAVRAALEAAAPVARRGMAPACRAVDVVISPPFSTPRQRGPPAIAVS